VNAMEKLIRLQELDAARDELARERDAGPLRLAAARAPLDAASAAEHTARERIQEATRARERLEKEIEFERSKLDERDRKLRQVRTNEEFQAGQKEMAEHRKRITAMEDEVLVHMERVEALQAEIRNAGAQAAKTRGQVEVVEAEVKARTEELDRRIAESDGEVAAMRTDIERSLLAHYDIVRTKRGGTAVSEVQRGICLACRTKIPAQMYNELHAPNTHHICPTCNRIVYVRWVPKAAASAEATG